MLDRTMILFGSGMSYGRSLMLTMLQKMEVNTEKFVDSLGPVSEVVA